MTSVRNVALWTNGRSADRSQIPGQFREDFRPCVVYAQEAGSAVSVPGRFALMTTQSRRRTLRWFAIGLLLGAACLGGAVALRSGAADDPPGVAGGGVQLFRPVGAEA